MGRGTFYIELMSLVEESAADTMMRNLFDLCSSSAAAVAEG